MPVHAVDNHELDLSELTPTTQGRLALPRLFGPVEQGFLGRCAAFKGALDRLLRNFGRRVGPSDQDLVGEVRFQDIRRDFDLKFQA